MNRKEVYSKLPAKLESKNKVDNTEKYLEQFVRSAVPDNCFFNWKNSIYVLPRTAQKKQSKNTNKKAYISRKEKQKLGFLKCSKTGWNYHEFAQLRQMWKEYMKNYLNIVNKHEINFSNYNTLLGKADYHGAEMKIIRSKCPSMVGLTGTCLLETKNTFQILSKDNKCKIIPKKDNVFEIRLTNLVFTIFGKYITMRTADRSIKKIKSQMIYDL